LQRAADEKSPLHALQHMVGQLAYVRRGAASGSSPTTASAAPPSTYVPIRNSGPSHSGNSGSSSQRNQCRSSRAPQVRHLGRDDRGQRVQEPTHRGVIDPQAVENHTADQDGGRHSPLRGMGNDHHGVWDSRGRQERAARRTTAGTPAAAAHGVGRIPGLSPPERQLTRALPAARHRRGIRVWRAAFCVRPGADTSSASDPPEPLGAPPWVGCATCELLRSSGC
jgi:hypothetical protein